jgi:hypothetical protein
MQKWQELFLSAIVQNYYDFTFYHSCSNEGTCIFLFARQDMQPRMKEITLQEVKAGTDGFASNQGAVHLRLKIDGTSIDLVNCQLDQGEGKPGKRVQKIMQVLNGALQSGVEHCDAVIVFGDLNFRVKLDYDTAKNAATRMIMK